MEYRVISYKGRVRESELWRNYSLHACQQQVRSLVSEGLAEKAEIFTSDGKIVARYPRGS